jgi:hypothetical protein
MPPPQQELRRSSFFAEAANLSMDRVDPDTLARDATRCSRRAHARYTGPGRQQRWDRAEPAEPATVHVASGGVVSPTPS